MVERIPRQPATKELVRLLASLQGLRFDEDRLAELATSMEMIQRTLEALQPELDGVEPAVVQHLRKG